MNFNDEPIAIELTRVLKDSNGTPVITLSNPSLPFKPGQVLQASVYDGYIVIAPALSDGQTH